ncbi:aromatic-ring-hydroxylating dioxygenase subunit beta [Nonomuraea wenchangensis]|uniref:3-phenylpropionate/cinnamic acid dioxygenase, small subunit n=1 Tax=Nonomuraea wenchangensis TaxID=568860 RepID=A0A1I0L0N3_9ACTN|nr:aromatic-ring-hydroxylating dioxygenase subunit beta [Nonomuraea wenchangensis]SEU32792.1 3-phenylpropionate/cinnamic acid dioxygenase, small subunit [Nonomuraea wenchangensis]
MSLAVDPATYTLAAQFLALEARLLDEGREEEWLELLDDDLLYTVPSRQAALPRSAEINRDAWRVRDTKAHIVTRVRRGDQGHAYSEVPPSRTSRLVGSILVEPTDQADVIAVRSTLLVYRQRGIDVHFDLIPARRADLLRLTADGPRLLRREVVLTETTLKTPNLGVFL